MGGERRKGMNTQSAGDVEDNSSCKNLVPTIPFHPFWDQRVPRELLSSQRNSLAHNPKLGRNRISSGHTPGTRSPLSTHPTRL